MNLEITNPSENVIFAKCLSMQELALSEKQKVGCVLLGINPNTGKYSYFGGSNMETSISFTIHGEIIALHDCLHHRCYPVHIYVTSKSEENVFLCGTCRQQFLEVNRNLLVTVFNPEGTIKGTKPLKTLLPYSKDTKKKNDRFLDLCKINPYP